MQNLKELQLSNYCLTKDGELYSLFVNRFLNSWVDAYGYKSVLLKRDDGAKVNYKIHRLVAQTFLPNDNPARVQVNHIDGDKLNSKLSNLEWATPSENTWHANRTGLRTPTHLTSSNKLPESDEVIHDWTEVGVTDLSEDEVHKICQMLQDGYRACDVSRMTGYDRRYVQYIRDNAKLKWAHIVVGYDFSKINRKEITNPDTVVKVCQMLRDGVGVLEISRVLGCNRKLVGNIKNKKTYVSISNSYSF